MSVPVLDVGKNNVDNVDNLVYNWFLRKKRSFSVLSLSARQITPDVFIFSRKMFQSRICHKRLSRDIKTHPLVQKMIRSLKFVRLLSQDRYAPKKQRKKMIPDLFVPERNLPLYIAIEKEYISCGS